MASWEIPLVNGGFQWENDHNTAIFFGMIHDHEQFRSCEENGDQSLVYYFGRWAGPLDF